MNGATATLRREHADGRTFTTRGIIIDSQWDDHDQVTGIRIQGVSVETGQPRDSWYAVGANALRGSLLVRQTVTLDCGHALTYGCDCDTIAAEAGPDSACPCGCEHSDECTYDVMA
jgi:hypothetical protein